MQARETIESGQFLASHGSRLLSPRKLAVGLALVIAAAVMVWRGHAMDLQDDAVAALFVMAALVGMSWPVLDRRTTREPMAPLVALVGCDGSGKSTLSADLRAHLGNGRLIELCYLGLGSGELGERLKRLPVIGRALERKLAGKAKQARTKGEKIPGLPTAIVVYGFSLIRLRRFQRMLAMRRAGMTVITDRYPQVDVPGFYDGPGLSAAKPGNWLVAALARRERRMYDWMATFRPDLVIRLNVDVETAHARKPDHKYELLRQKVAATRKLRFAGAAIVDVDSARPYSDVYSDAERLVRQTIDAGHAADPAERSAEAPAPLVAGRQPAGAA